MILIKNGIMMDSEKKGLKDILLSDRIEEISDNIEDKYARIIDAENMFVVPGFIDIHNHVNGAGGEGGPETRSIPVHAENLFKSGITTVVGLLGTDGYTRSLIDLLMHVRKLQKQGMNAFMLTGSYQVPGPTITGKVANDIILINEILGVKISLSDHRSSYPERRELISLATESRVAGMLSSKPGFLMVHLGDGKEMFNPILDVIDNTEIPITQFIPTHIDRNEDLLNAAVEYGKKDGYLDLTGHAEGKYPRTIDSIKYLIYHGVNIDNITVTTDGNGSMPEFDENGNLVKIEISDSSSLIKLFKYVMENDEKFIQDFLRTVTSNPANRLKLKKGKIEKGYDSDLLIFDQEINLIYVISKGNAYKI
ncbi:MAG: beta-aspartyl-peptidase [Thermoplasmata archaeon]